MHPYASDSNEREHVMFGILIVSVLIAFGVDLLARYFNFELHWLVDLSFFIFYVIIYGFFDRILWKFPFFHSVGLVRFPILEGSWEGTINSSYSPTTDIKAQLLIYQTWSRMNIHLKTDKSSSDSLTATIITENKKKIEISYEYQNNPEYGTGLEIHRGTARLTLSENRTKLTGNYYNDPMRETYGNLTFEKK